MGRCIIGAVVGYIVMAVIVMSLFMGMWFGLGPDKIMEPGLFKGNLILNIGAPLISVVAALACGWVCFKISRSRKTVMVLAGLILIAGQVAAYYTVAKPVPGVRDPTLTPMQTLEQGREPNWYAMLNPLIGWGGTLMGGLCLGACRKKQP